MSVIANCYQIRDNCTIWHTLVPFRKNYTIDYSFGVYLLEASVRNGVTV